MFVQYMFIVVFPYMLLLCNDVVFEIHYHTCVNRLAAKKLLR